MKFLQHLCLLLFLLAVENSNAQDTIQVYFDFGSSKLSDEQQVKLNSTIVKYDFSTLDSISYIGMADSIGKISANIKLSEKRAKNVARHCKSLINKEISIRIFALGERTEGQGDQHNRRVDVVLHYPKVERETVDLDIDTSLTRGRNCYYVDYYLLHRSSLQIALKRKKEYYRIETIDKHENRYENHYYGTISKSGEFKAVKVKWSSRVTGKLWWAQRRYTTMIPKKNYEQFKIFKISDPPCDSCDEAFFDKAIITQEDTCLMLDHTLHDNFQYKLKLFNNKFAKVRVPQQYVSIDDHYFIGCNMDHEIVWQSKNGRRKMDYYYTKLPIKNNRLENITRVMSCCKYERENSMCNSGRIRCRSFNFPVRSLFLIAEAGAFYHQSEIFPYAGIGLYKEGYNQQINFLAAAGNDENFYLSVNYRYSPLYFPFSIFKSVSTWQEPGNRGTYRIYGRLYAGTQLRQNFYSATTGFLEHSAYIGVSAFNSYTDQNNFIKRIFFQYGIAYDYLQKTSIKFYPIIQFGATFSLIRVFNRE